MASIKEIINKILDIPTDEDNQKAKEQKALLDKIQDNVNDISSEYTKVDRRWNDLQNSIDLMEMYANSSISRTVGKIKNRDIFNVRIIKRVGQNHQRTGLSVIIDCEQKCVIDEMGEIIVDWSKEERGVNQNESSTIQYRR